MLYVDQIKSTVDVPKKFDLASDREGGDESEVAQHFFICQKKLRLLPSLVHMHARGVSSTADLNLNTEDEIFISFVKDKFVQKISSELKRRGWEARARGVEFRHTPMSKKAT